MASQTIPIATLGGGAVVVELTYDDATLAAQSVSATNTTNRDAVVKVTRPNNSILTLTFPAGQTITRNIPGGAYTLLSDVDGPFFGRPVTIGMV